MKKNIWIFHHYADPYDGHWTGTYDLYKFLVTSGHAVTVFSSSFSHYTRTETRLKTGELTKEQDFHGMKFVFLRTPPYQENDWCRSWNMFVFGVRAYRAGISRKENPDIVVGSTPHPFCALAAALVARRRRARFFLEVHDLWLQYLLDTRLLSPISPLAWMLKKIDEFCYARAEKIFALWPKMYEYLAGWKVPFDKVIWTPLGVDFDRVTIPEPHEKKHGEPLIVACTARFGPASNVMEILEAAKILQEKNRTDICFELFGSGPQESDLRKFAQDNSLRNVRFMGLIPKEDVPGQLARADICVGSLPSVPTYNKYGCIPTKMLDYMASNRPTVYISAVSDSLIHRSRAGVVVRPNDPQGLAESFIALSSLSASERAAMGEKGIAYLRQYHDLKSLARRIEEVFLKDA